MRGTRIQYLRRRVCVGGPWWVFYFDLLYYYLRGGGQVLRGVAQYGMTPAYSA